jgi:hypothetical protein
MKASYCDIHAGSNDQRNMGLHDLYYLTKPNLKQVGGMFT